MTALNLEVSVPPVSAGTDPGTRWLRVVCFGLLASRVADSIQAGDRVTVRASDLSCRAWVSDTTGKPAARITLRAYDIAASMLTDTLTTGGRNFRGARSGAGPLRCDSEDGRPQRNNRRECCDASHECAILVAYRGTSWCRAEAYGD